MLCELEVDIMVPTEICTVLLSCGADLSYWDFYLVSIETNDKPTNNDLFHVMMSGWIYRDLLLSVNLFGNQTNTGINPSFEFSDLSLSPDIASLYFHDRKCGYRLSLILILDHLTAHNEMLWNDMFKDTECVELRNPLLCAKMNIHPLLHNST